MRRPTLVVLASAALAGTVAASPVLAQRDATAAAPQVVKHTVKKGDTLWDIAKFYLKDPFKWPEVFHANTDIIKNPHWIYPGQVLTIEGEAVKDEVAAQVGNDGFVVAQPQPRSSGTVFLGAAAPRLAARSGVIAKPASYTVREGEYEAAPYVIDARQPTGAGHIISRIDRIALGLESKAGYKIFDQLYVTAPANTTSHVGDELVLARNGGEIADQGIVVQPTGVMRIDSIGAKGILIGTIVRQFMAIHADEWTVPYDGSFTPTTVRPVTGDYATAGKLRWIASAPELPSIQTYVVLQTANMGTVHTGDRFAVYDSPVERVEGDVQPLSTATVQVVRVTPFGVTGMIIDHTSPQVAKGMMVRQTAKMP